MVDSIKVYVKTKESFGWPEETDEFPESSITKNLQQQGVITVTESETVSFAPLPLTCADRLVIRKPVLIIKKKNIFHIKDVM